MEDILTSRTRINIADSDFCAKISYLNKDQDGSEYLDGLNKEDKDLIFEDTKELSRLLWSMVNDVGDAPSISFGAWSKENDPIGFVTVLNFDKDISEVQIEIKPCYQNQGYGYEIMSAMLKYLFATYHYQAIRYRVMPYNIPSIKLVEKLGGTLQKSKSKQEELLFRIYHLAADKRCIKNGKSGLQNNPQ